MKNLLLAVSAATLLLPAPAFARHHHYDRYHRTETVRVYESDGRYVRPHRLGRNDHVWRGRDGRYYCRRDNGTTGLVIGAAAGGLLGNELSRGSGDRTLGTIIGAIGGGLLGQSVDRGDLQCR
ncbi:MAG TPA: glycine zipper 2TM domain-containing protein [Sphingomonadaceae bacterium]